MTRPYHVFPALCLFMLLLLGQAGSATAETCEYDTAWGVLTIHYNWNNNTATGNYPHKRGSVSGAWTGQNTLEGTWQQSDGTGYFSFKMHASGFSGRWRYAVDSSWRGNWDGTLRGCY